MKNKEQAKIEIEPQPAIKDLTTKYLKEINEDSDIQMLQKMYFFLHKKKPDTSLDAKKLSMRILFSLKFDEFLKDDKAFKKNKKNKFKWPFKSKKVFKKSRKKRRKVLIWFLNIQGELQPPQLCTLYSGNMIIIRNRPYEVDPRAFWRQGKYSCLLIKEIDRRPKGRQISIS